jgi:hypothetical protein
MAEAPEPSTTPTTPDPEALPEALSSSSPPVGVDVAPAIAAPAPVDALNARLQQARQLLVRVAFAEGVVAALAGVVAATLFAVLVLGVVPFSTPLRVVLLLGIVVGIGAAAAHVLYWRGLPLRHDVVVAARLEDALARSGRGIGDTVRAAVELRDNSSDSRLGRSRALCDAHIEATVKKLDDGAALHSLPAVGLEAAVTTLLGSAGVFVVLVVTMAMAKDVVVERVTKLFSPAAAAAALAERAAQLPPIVTDVTVTLHFPAYMARADEVIPGASGDVTAPRGTEVTIEGRADRDVDRAALVVTGGPTELALAAEVKGRQLRARFTVEAPGTWRFKIGSGRKEVLDPVARKILVRADAPPVVRLEEPAVDAVVQLEDTVPLRFAAEDDTGVTKVRVVVKRQGSSRPPFSLDLLDAPGSRTVAGGGGLVIKDTGARPGDKLSVTIEALDNDTVSGPNVGRSTTRVLTVFLASEHHKEVIARLEALMMQMVELLGDELEAPIPDTAAVEGQKRVLERHKQLLPPASAVLATFAETLKAIATDDVFGGDDDAVRAALANMQVGLTRAITAKASSVERAPVPEGRPLPLGIWRRLLDANTALVSRLENDVLYLEDLLQRERVQEAKKLVEDMKQAQQDLKALLQQYKDSGDDAVRQELLEEIKRMQQQLGELAHRLGELRREVPDEFINEEALKADEMFDNADSLDEMIEEGRLEDAASALEEMLESTQKMIDELEETEDELGGAEARELQEQMTRFGEELSSLEQAQKESLQQTEALMESARKKAEERYGKQLQAALAEAKKKAEAAAEALKRIESTAGLSGYEEEDTDTAKARTAELQKALESGDVDDALRVAEEGEAAARDAEASIRRRGRFAPSSVKRAEAALREAAVALREAREKLDGAMPDPSEMLDAKDRDKLNKQADRQQQLAEQAQKLQQQMAEIGKKAPIFGPKHTEQLNGARQAMSQAGGRLKNQGKPRADRGGLRQARAAQSQALQQLQALQQDLQEQAKQSGGKGGGGIPMPLPGGGSPGGREGERGRSKDDVKIPDGSDFKVKDAFRKDILDAMREGAPDDWAGEVKRYYEELIK